MISFSENNFADPFLYCGDYYHVFLFFITLRFLSPGICVEEKNKCFHKKKVYLKYIREELAFEYKNVTFILVSSFIIYTCTELVS